MRSRVNSLAGFACLAVLLVLSSDKLPVRLGGERAAASAPRYAAASPVMPWPIAPADSIQRGRSDHFDFYTRGTALPMPLAELQTSTEQVYAYVTDRLSARLNGRIAVIVEPPGTLCGLRGFAKTATPTITIKAGPDTRPDQFLGVLAHELGHVVELFAYGADAKGDVVLLEAVATWGAGAYWTQWQGWAAFDDGVAEALAAGRHVTLERTGVKGLNGSVQIGLRDGCERDLFYTQWAAFIDHLVAQHGLAAIGELLSWPGLPAPDGEGGAYVRADYEGVYGEPLPELIGAWLAGRN